METFSRLDLDRLLRPRSIAIVGASSTPPTLGEAVLSNLERASFSGDLYLVNPKYTEIRGRACLSSIDSLPDGVDCAVLAIPRDGVLQAVAACSRRGVRAVIIFSAGFAESGPEGRADQDQLAHLAREHNMIIEGPNCLGMVNGVDGIPLTFVATPPDRLNGQKGLAVVSQSGAMAAVLGVSLRSHGVGISYTISTGNEATTGVEDYVEYLIRDRNTYVIAMIVELFRQPLRFLHLVRRAREADKHIVLLHPGRTSAARASAATHTGAMLGSYGVMRTKVSHAGVLVVETLEELQDVCRLLTRCSSLPADGPAVLTESGAFKALLLDLCKEIGLPLPAFSDRTTSALQATLPYFIPVTNPLDISAQGLVDPDLYRRTLPPLLDDEQVGSVVLTIILTDESTGNLKFPPILEALETIRPAKPVIFAALDEGAFISPLFLQRLRAAGVPFFSSPERALRALARLRHSAAKKDSRQSAPVADPSAPRQPTRVMPEYRSKELLASLGIAVPAGALVSTLDEAQHVAARIGFPVVLKAQSRQLPHKSVVGGVLLNLLGPEELSAGWERLHLNLARALPHLALDGVLVERMEKEGAELTVGARNDPDWGPVLLVAFGGIKAHALHDRRLLPPEFGFEAIVDELNNLKGAAVLRGFRGSPALDVSSAADIILRLGQLMLCHPEILEVDINPVVVYPEGQGALALDALIVTRNSQDSPRSSRKGDTLP